MNNLQVFNNPEFGNIRTITMDGEPWFVGKDVAEALGYSNTRKALADHVDEEDRFQGDGVTIRDSIGREQNPVCINESGLYSLILSSKLPSAKKFKRWVTSEVLPSIRKTGTYSMNTSTETDKLIKCAEIMAGCLEGNRPYVLNIMRHIVSDIDDVDEGEPVLENTVALVSMPESKSYRKPFNHNQFNNYLLTYDIKYHWLEAELGCSTGLVRRWAYGQSKPTEYYRVQLCKVLHLPIGYFDNELRVRRMQSRE